MMEHLIANLGGTGLRHDTLDGRDYLVVPVAMMSPGVWEGSEGAVLYDETDLAACVPSWNHKPVVVYHPEVDGKPLSASKREVVNTQQIGILMDTNFDTKQRSFAWLDIEKTNKVDDRIIPSLNEGKILEVSTGLFVDKADDGPGEKFGKQYKYRAINHKPDHLAILPDKIGACSIKDGAGLLQVNEKKYPKNTTEHMRRSIQNALKPLDINIVGNELSFSDISMRIMDMLASKYGEPGKSWYGWCEGVYPDYVIFFDDGKYWKVGYTATDTEVMLDGTRTEVQRSTEYVPVDNQKTTESEDSSMTKGFDRKVLVNALITNGFFEEGDRKKLEAYDDKKLATYQPLINTADPGDEDDSDPPANNGKKKKMKTDPASGDDTPAIQANHKMNLKEFIEHAPAPIATILNNSVQMLANETTRLIGLIMNSERNTFKEAQLIAIAERDFNELQGIANLVGVSAATPGDGSFSGMIGNNYGAAAGSFISNAGAQKVDPCEFPQLDFKVSK